MHKISFLIILFFSGFLLKAQTGNNGPFSRYGIGDVNPFYTGSQFGMSGNFGVLDSNQLFLDNPATYAFISKHYTIFNVGIMGRASQLSSSNGTSSSFAANINNISIGLPVAKHIGLAFGLRPYSLINYDVEDPREINGNEVYYSYQGVGSLNDVSMGLGFSIIEKEHRYLGVGFNYAYTFGTLLRERSVGINNSSYLSTNIEDERRVMGLSPNFSLAFKDTLREGFSYSISAAYNAQRSFNSESTEYAYSYAYNQIDPNFRSPVDTISYSVIDGNIVVPASINIGGSIEFRPRTKVADSIKNSGKFYRRNFKSSHWIITGGYMTSDWQQYSESYDSFSTSADFGSSWRANLGVQVIPVFDRRKLMSGSKWYQTSQIRFGGHYGQSHIKINDEQLVDYGISFGLGLPLLYSKSRSMVNLGVNLGTRGLPDGSVLKENYAGIYLGFSFTPTRNDYWFFKRKYD
jgi:hypothetical protein